MGNNGSQDKKPKLTNIAKHTDLLDIYGHGDVIDIESVSTDTSGCQALKNAILGKQWLNSAQMYNANMLILDARYNVNGFQDTMLAPILQKNGQWHIPVDGLISQKAPSANIHYNCQQHRLTSFQFENGDIYLLDRSLSQKKQYCLNDSLKIQLSQIYDRGKSQITVKIPDVQQQYNSYDCGLFAIANMMEFVVGSYHGLQDGRQGFVFIQSEMQKKILLNALAKDTWNHFQKEN